MRCDCGYDFVSGKIESPYLKEKAENSSWWRRSYWPVIYDSESARKAGKAGTLASVFFAGWQVLFAFLSIFNISNFNDASGLVDAGIFAFLGFMIRRMSRVAAVIALVIFVAERVYTGTVYGIRAGIGVVAIFWLLAFISGVRGTFAYHHYRQLQAGQTPSLVIQQWP